MVSLQIKSPSSTVTLTEKSEIVQKKPTKDSLGRAYGTGRRKNAVARVWIKPGSGKVEINHKECDKYFGRETHRRLMLQPMSATKTLGVFDIFCTVKGGGHSGQAGAIRHGLARALDNFDPNFHNDLKHGGFLTRDSRVVERKKYGKHKARKSTQFSKR